MRRIRQTLAVAGPMAFFAYACATLRYMGIDNEDGAVFPIFGILIAMGTWFGSMYWMNEWSKAE